MIRREFLTFYDCFVVDLSYLDEIIKTFMKIASFIKGNINSLGIMKYN